MNRSQHLSLDEVRSIFRVLGHARDLRHDHDQQEKVIVDAMTELLGADFGHAMQMAEYRPKTPTYTKRYITKRYIPGTIQDRMITGYLAQWGKNAELLDDPVIQLAWGQPNPVVTLSRSSVMSMNELWPYRIFDELIEPSGLNDAIITFFRYPGSDTTRQYVFQRTVSQEEFGLRELRLADLFIKEMRKLFTDGFLETPDVLSKLPNRLSLIAHQLRTGKSQRQIAVAECLSYNTVRSYTKELYNTVGVSSREELVAKLFLNTGEN